MAVRRWWIPLFWIGLAFFTAIQTWLSMITHGHSIVRMLVYFSAVWSVWIVFTFLVLRLVQRIPLAPPRMRNVLIHAMFALLFAIAHVALWISLTVWIQPYDWMGIREFGPNFLPATMYRLPLEIIIYTGAVAVAHAIEISRRARELETSLAQARLHALELQIQPHFLFNTLNAISSLVRARQNAAAVEVIAGLSDLLRYTLDHAGEQRVPLEQETAMVQRYLGIQQVRFADRLDVNIDVADDVRRAAVPTLILQPLAENAIRHGIARSASAGRVELRAFRRNGSLEIEMFNTGSLAGDNRRGLGLRNTEERLRQLYGSSHRFELRESGDGVLASIAIPWSEVA